MYSERIPFAIEHIIYQILFSHDRGLSKFDEEKCVICLKDFNVERPSISIGHKGLGYLDRVQQATKL